jgi:hypothetical protein
VAEQFCNFMDYGPEGMMFSEEQTTVMYAHVAQNGGLYNGTAPPQPPTPTGVPTPPALTSSGGSSQVNYGQNYYVQSLLTSRELTSGGGVNFAWSALNPVTGLGLAGRAMRVTGNTGRVIPGQTIQLVDVDTLAPLALALASATATPSAGTRLAIVPGGTPASFIVTSDSPFTFALTTKARARLELAGTGLALGIDATGATRDVVLVNSASSEFALNFRAAVSADEDTTTVNFNRSYLFRERATGLVMLSGRAGGVWWVPLEESNAAFLNSTAGESQLFQGAEAFISDSNFGNRMITFNNGADLFFGPAEGTRFVVEGANSGQPVLADSTLVRFRVDDDEFAATGVARYLVRRGGAGEEANLSEYSSRSGADAFAFEFVNIARPTEKGQLIDEPLEYLKSYRITQPPLGGLELNSGGGRSLFYSRGERTGRDMYFRSARVPTSTDEIHADEPFWICDAATGMQVFDASATTAGGSNISELQLVAAGAGTVWTGAESTGLDALTTASRVRFQRRDAAPIETFLNANATTSGTDGAVTTRQSSYIHQMELGNVAIVTVPDALPIDGDGDDTGDGFPTWAIIVIVVVALILLIVLIVLLVRRRDKRANQQTTKRIARAQPARSTSTSTTST